MVKSESNRQGPAERDVPLRVPVCGRTVDTRHGECEVTCGKPPTVEGGIWPVWAQEHQLTDCQGPQQLTVVHRDILPVRDTEVGRGSVCWCCNLYFQTIR